MPALQFGRFMQRPCRVGKMRAGNRTQIGAAGGDDAVDMVDLGNRPDGNRLDANLVADAVGKRRLVHAAINRFRGACGLTRRDVDEVAAGGLEEPRNFHRVVGGIAARCPVVGRDANAHRQLRGPDFPDRAEHFERITAAVFYRAAVFVATLVGQRRDETRQQVTMGAMQFQPVKAGLHRITGRLHKFGPDAVHVGARHGLRLLVGRAVSDRAGCQQRPVAFGQRLVGRFPADLRRSLGSAVAELQTDFGAGARGMNEIDNPLESQHLLLVPQAGAARGDAAFGVGRGHFHEHQRRAAQRPRAQMHQVKVLRHAVNRAVHGHGRDDDAVLQRQPAHRQRQQHRRRRGGPPGGQRITRSEKRGGLSCQPLFIALQPLSIAYAQVFVADALRARHHGIEKLFSFQPAVAIHVFKPFGRVARRVLDFQHFD